jgi:hypothetical protein
MRSKNVINNKNIIQICYEKVKRKKRRQQSRNQYNETSSKSINIQPKFINSFPNSTRLEPDDRKVRFIQSMRDPFSTKSPYSIYDNGSNTFQREGNTLGVEEEVLPQLRQDDYFQEPRSFGGVPQSSRPQYRAPERFQVASPLSPITQRDEYDDDAGRSWYSPNLNDGEEVDDEEEEYQMNQEVPQTRFLSNKPFSAPIPTFSSPYRSPEIQDEPITIDSPIPAPKEKTYEQESTRFGSNKPFSAPMFSTPYRSQQIQDDPIILDTPITEDQEKEFQQLNEEIKQFQESQAKEPTEIDENERRRQEQKQANQALSNELERKRKIRKKYTTVRDKLQALLATGETKVDKESKLKLDIINLLKDPDFKEYTGDKNIRNTSGAQKILDFINAGSIGLLEQIKQLEADKIESPLKRRDPPRSQANIQTLRSAGGAISGSGISQYSKLPIAKR